MKSKRRNGVAKSVSHRGKEFKGPLISWSVVVASLVSSLSVVAIKPGSPLYAA